MNKSIEWAKQEHSPQKRLLLILFLSIPFVALPTLLLSRLAPAMDKRLRLPSWRNGRLTVLAGGLLAIPGWLLAVWTIYTQFTRAKGTPSPTMATQKLLADGPFSVCRNPMALGTILAYLGTGVMVGSPFAVGLVALFTAVLSIYIKTVEEKELLVRFGDEYAAYKQNTPFMIPRLNKWERIF